MEIEDVKVVWIKVIPSIREVIDVCELTDFVADFFAKSTIQKIKAQDKHAGLITASNEFFEEAQRKPGSFPVILAALKKTNQSYVLKLILQTVVKEIKSERYDAIFDLVRQEARKYSVDVEDEIKFAQGLLLYNRHQHGTAKDYIAEVQNQEQLSADQEHNTGTSGGSHIKQRSHIPQADCSPQLQPDSPDSNIPEIVPNTRPSVLPSQAQVIYQRRQSQGQTRDTPDVRLCDMKAVARRKISVKLEAPSPDEDTQVLSLLLDLEDLDITAAECSEIEKSRKPGKDFYDKLAQMNYTAGKLVEMLERHDCHDAAETVRDQSFNIVRPSPSRENLRYNENNLDLGLQDTPNEQGPQLNILSGIQYTERVVPGRSRSVADGNQLELNSERPDSIDDNTVVHAEVSNSNNWESKQDEGKGTQAIVAVGDRENTKSQLPPEAERAKLLRDRVGQHSGDQGNLNSFADIGKPSEQNKNIQTGDQPCSHDFSSVSALQQPRLVEQIQQQQVSSNTEIQSEMGHQSEETSKKDVTNYRTHLDSYHKLHPVTLSPDDQSSSSVTQDDTDTDEPDGVGLEVRNKEEKETNN